MGAVCNKSSVACYFTVCFKSPSASKICILMPGLWAALRHCGKHASISSLDARLHCPPRFFSINKQAIPVWKLVAYDWFGPTKKTCNDMRQCHEKNAPVWCLRDCIARFLPRLKERFRSLVAMISCPYKCASTNTVVITRMAKFGEVVSVSTVALIGIATADSTRQLMGKCQLTYSRASHHGWFSFSALCQQSKNNLYPRAGESSNKN
jgi:hypothetical protein